MPATATAGGEREGKRGGKTPSIACSGFCKMSGRKKNGEKKKKTCIMVLVLPGKVEKSPEYHTGYYSA